MALPKEKRLEVERLALGDLLEALKGNALFRGQLLQEFSEYSNRSFAASFVIAARKPVGWKDAQLPSEQNPVEESQLARREYYELRMTVILRHHEVFLYKRLSRENGIELNPGRPKDQAPISDLLRRCKPNEMLSHESVLVANDALRDVERDLRALRDEWIKPYTAAAR